MSGYVLPSCVHIGFVSSFVDVFGCDAAAAVVSAVVVVVGVAAGISWIGVVGASLDVELASSMDWSCGGGFGI